MKKRVTYLIIIVVMALALVGCGERGQTNSGDGVDSEESVSQTGSNDSTYTISLGHATTDTHPYHEGVKVFKEIVEEKTDGDITIELFPNSALGAERDMVEGLQLGTLEMTLVSTAPLSGYTSAFMALDLPYIFRANEHARNALDSETGQRLLDELETEGIVGLVYYENGLRHFTNNDGPIETPEDLDGKKIRVMENPVMMDTIAALGADPTPMAFNELYTGLQQGTIDGQENPIAQIYNMRFYETQDYISMTNHFYAPAPLLISKTFWDTLPEDYQMIIMEASEESRDFMREESDRQEADMLEEMIEYGVEVNEPELDPFVEAVQSVYDKYVGEGKEISQDLVDELLSYD